MASETDRAGVYDRLHAETELRFPLEDYPVFVEWLNVPGDGSGFSLLDVACGQGFFLEAAGSRRPGLDLHGIDFSHVALEKAGARAPGARLRHGSAYELPYQDAAFQYCVNLGSLEHFDDPVAALREMGRVLSPDGKALVIVPNAYYLGTIWRVMTYGDADDQGQEGVTEFRTINRWTATMEAAGFDVLGVRGYNGEHHIAWYFHRPQGVITEHERRWRAVLNMFVKPLIPLNLAQCFAYTLRRPPLPVR